MALKAVYRYAAAWFYVYGSGSSRVNQPVIIDEMKIVLNLNLIRIDDVTKDIERLVLHRAAMVPCIQW